MYANKSDFDHGKRRPHISRGSRVKDEDDRREEWDEPPRSSVREAFDKHVGDGYSRSERLSSGDYNEPYTKDFNSDTDWRKRRISSHERSGSEKRRRAVDDDEDDQYKYQHEPQDLYRQSPERFSHRNKAFKRTGSVEEGYSRRRSPEESRYSKHQDEFHYSPYREDSHYRLTEYNRGRDSRERSRSPWRACSRDTFTKSYTPPRPRSDSFSRDLEDDYHDRTRFSLNGSSRLPVSSHRRLSPPPPPPPPAAAPEKKMSKGFQRFLDVLNMGVNVETLTKIVTQGSPDVKVPPPSSHPHDSGPWTTARSPRQNPQYWPQTERNQRLASPPPRSYSSNGRAMSEERAMESQNPERNFPSPTDSTPNFDDEHKRQQVHDVLQAIGIKLEFEELGRMSTRIQERLYGKKTADNAPPNREEEVVQEKIKEAYVPKRRSGSNSSGLFQDNKKKAHWTETRYPYQKESSGPQQNPSHYCAQGISPTPQHRPNQEPPPTPIPSHLVPPPSPMFNCPPSPFSVFPPNLPPPLPNMPMPQLPPFLSPYLQTPPHPCPNMFPPTGPPSAPFPNPQPKTRRHSYLNLITVPPSEFSNYEKSQKSKNTVKNNTNTASNSNNNSNNQKRHRYLQEVQTKK